MNIRSISSFLWQGILCLALLFGYTDLTFSAFTEPLPGDVYKEYSLALGGNTWRITDPNTTYGPDAWQFLPNSVISFTGVDLTLATKAELVIDKWGGHLGTQNKRFRVNGNDSIMVPELLTTPSNSECFMQEPNLTLPIPLSHLQAGTNSIQGSCDNQACYYFNWGQWGWYGMTLRIYYAASKPHPTGTILTPTTGSTIGDNPTITAIATGVPGIEKVEFFGYYEGYDYDGDGIYNEYHRSYRRGSALDLQNHLGTATVSPYSITWDTEWLPDQTAGSVKIMARVKDNDGVWYVLPIADNLTFQRASGSVRLYKSFNVPTGFWARNNDMTRSCNLKIPVTDSSAIWTAARIYISTWNGSDQDGDIHWYKVNNYQIPQTIGYGYEYKYDEIDLPLSVLKTGVNKFQAYANTSAHHGIEINWPGPSFLVKYQNTIPPPPPPSSTIQTDEFNGGSLNAGVWEFVDYLGDGSYATNGSQVSISVPAGTSHDIYTNENRAPRVLQYITDIQTFEVEAKFDATLSTMYQLNGIVVEQDATNLIRFDFYTNGTNTFISSLSLTNNTATSHINSSIGTPPSPLFMRVLRNADQWTLRYSLDGATWITPGTFSHPLVATAIGVFAGNAGGSPPAFTGSIDYFRNLGEVPVQLASFTALVVNNSQVRLDWMTVSETNNYGFEIQKSFGSENNFETIPNSFIPGHGTTLEPHRYSFVDAVTNNGIWYYRLKQIDLDGSIHYSEPVHVNTLTSVTEKPIPTEFALAQNYPNPFNPTTRIEYALPTETNVKIQIFNTLGQLVKTVVDARQSPGYHTAEFNAIGLGSGIYFYRLTTAEVSFTKKMMLVR